MFPTNSEGLFAEGYSVDFYDVTDGGETDGTWPFPTLDLAERFARFILSYAPNLYAELVSVEKDEGEEAVRIFKLHSAVGRLLPT